MFPAVRFRLEIVEECGSTQELLLGRRGTDAFHGQAVLARRQSAARGRRGRDWWTGEGNLALSFALELEDEAAAGLLPFVCGLAAHRSVAAFLSEDPGLLLKWPNDLLLQERKLAGIVTQARTIPQWGMELVAGIGLNLRAIPPGLERDAIALSELVGAAELPSPEEFAGLFLRTLEQLFLEAVDFHWLRREWESAARLSQVELRIVGEEGRYRPEALLSTGELLVRDENAQARKLASEELSVRLIPARSP